MNATTGAPFDDLYSVQPFAHSVPAESQPFSAFIRSIICFCQSNFTSGSFSPAAWNTGTGSYLLAPISAAAPAADGAIAANTPGRAAASRYVNPPPFEWPVEYTRLAST